MSTLAERWAAFLTSHSKAVIVVMLVATVLIGAGAIMVEEDSGLDQFEGDSEAAQAATFIETNFIAEGAENETTLQIIRHETDEDDVLSREELLSTLELQQEIVEHPDFGHTLVDEEPTIGVANVLSLFHLGQLLLEGDSDGFDTADLSELADSDIEALARLLGFDADESGTVVDLVRSFDRLDSEDGFDPAELNQTERESLAVLLGFDGDEQATVASLLGVLGSENPLAHGDIETLDDGDIVVLTELLGLDPDDADTVEALLIQLESFDDAALDPMAFDESERKAATTLLGFEGEQRSTVIEVLDTLGDPGAIGVDGIASLDHDQALVLAELFGYEGEQAGTVAEFFLAIGDQPTAGDDEVTLEPGDPPSVSPATQISLLATVLDTDEETVLEILATLRSIEAIIPDDGFPIIDEPADTLPGDQFPVIGEPGDGIPEAGIPIIDDQLEPIPDEQFPLPEDESIPDDGLSELDDPATLFPIFWEIATTDRDQTAHRSTGPVTISIAQDLDFAELEETQIRLLAISLGFDTEEEVATIVDLFDRLSGDGVGLAVPEAIDDEQTDVIATVLGFENDTETIGELFGSLSDEQGDGGPIDSRDLTSEEQAALATLLGFEGSEQATVIQIFDTFDGDNSFGAEFDSLDEDEADVLATLFGFDGDGDLLQEFFESLEAFDDSDAELLDPGEYAETERVALAELLGFDGEAAETASDALAAFGADEPPIELGAAETLTNNQQAFVADLMGFDSPPPAACYEQFEALGDSGSSPEQPQPTLECQIWIFEEMDDDGFIDAVEGILGPAGEPDALSLVPQSYDPGSTTAEAHNIFVTQETGGGDLGGGGFSDELIESQLQLQDMVENRDDTYLAFGVGILSSEIDQSLDDSTALVAPIALLFVILVLTLAYRDLLDILLGVFGIVAVLLWTFGFMGWTGIAFNQLMIAVPVLLIGLSIDYAIHVFMRHRERRGPDVGVGQAMTVALGGVGVALVWVTATGAIGFLSNLVSPIGPLQDFGVTSAFGMIAALLIFGALIPALKIELDTALEARGFDRRTRAFGTDGSRLSSLLRSGSVAARRAPIAVLALTILVTAGGVYGAVQVDTSFEEEDFLAEEPPAWTQQLPEPFAPSEYRVAQDLAFLQQNFQQIGREGEILIEGDITNDQILHWLDSTRDNASEHESVFILPNDEPDVDSPLSVMEDTATNAPESSFAHRYEQQRTNGLPEENITGLFDELTAINPMASEVIYQENGDYEALRMQVGIDGEVTQNEAAQDLEQIAAHLEAESGGQLEVVATGDPITNTEVEQNLFQTVLESLLITLVAVFAFLAIAYRLTGNPATLGIVTLLPVLFSVTWILGTMYLIGMPFNAMTGTIAALTIGLGIAYSIHISARYELELKQQEDVWKALDTTVTGTGGALLGSAATTVGGFGTLVVAIFPALQQFGIITGLTIIYAFLASVLVLPTLLVLWTKYLGPNGYFPAADAEDQSELSTGSPTASHDDD